MSTAKGPRRTQAERRGEAETRLVEAATKLVAEKGYDGFTLAEVGDAAGYSRGLAAHYFGRKEDLLALVARRVVEAYHSGVDRLPRSGAGLPRIAALIRQYAIGSETLGNRALGVLIAEALVRPGLKRTISELNARGHAELQAELEAGVAAGNILPGADSAQQAWVIYAFLRGLMGFAAQEQDFDPRAVAEAFISDIEARLGATPPKA